MDRTGRLGTGFALAAFALVSVGTVVVVPSDASARAKRAHASPGPSAAPSAAPSSAPSGAPSPGPSGTPAAANGIPSPSMTLAPLGQGSPLPYPAYGTPVPGVNAGVAAPDIPLQISLQQAIAIGFARSPSLATARGDVGVQAAAVRLARAGLLPLLEGTASTTYSYQQSGTQLTTNPITGTVSRTSFGGTIVTNALSASLRQLIFDGGKTALAVRAARSTETSFADLYLRDLQTVAFNVATAYYNYLAAERTTQVDLQIVKNNQVQEDLVRAQVSAGTTARVDIATAELPVAQARVAVVKAQGAELAAQAAFANAMGLDANIKVQPIDDTQALSSNSQISTIPVPPYDTAVKRALALRPDYDSAVQTLESSKESLSSAKRGYFPTIAATGDYGDTSTSVGGGALRNAGSVGASLSLPIFDQGVTAANIAQAKAQLGISQANLQTTLLNLQLNVKQALTNLVSARGALDQTAAEYNQAIAVLQSTQAQYKAGVTTLPLLLNAETGITQALTDQVTAVYTLRQAEQSYLYAVGNNYDIPKP
ncbi:MAG: TolC family protein [Vulcanimicrobiaceae bacterium]